MNLTKKEQAWLKRFEKTMDAAPYSLIKKMSSFTIGDDYIVLYDLVKFNKYHDENPQAQQSIKDHHHLVDDADCRLQEIPFPFCIESTAG